MALLRTPELLPLLLQTLQELGWLMSAVIARERFLNDASAAFEDVSGSLADCLRHDVLSLQKFAGNSAGRSGNRSCPVCGSVRVEQREVAIQKRAAQKSDQRLTVQKCQVCKRSTKKRTKLVFEKQPEKQVCENLDTPVKLNSKTMTLSSRDSHSPSSQPAIKSSSKKRAKERRDREGLKSILDKSKSTTNGPGSFSLMDFMSGGPK